MSQIKWVGIIKTELSDYQRGELPENAVKMRMPQSTGEMMVKALPFLTIPFVIVFASMFVKTYVSKQVVNPLFVLLGVVSGFIALLFHEWLHAVVYPKKATVYIGIYPKAFAAVALASYPLKRKRFIGMSLLPVILGVIPLALFCFMPSGMKELNGFLFGFSMMGLFSTYPDIYNVYQVLCQAPKGSWIQFEGDDLYYF